MEEALQMCNWALDLDPLNGELLAKRGEIKAYFVRESNVSKGS